MVDPTATDTMTTSLGARASRTRLRQFVPVGIVLVTLVSTIVGAVVGQLFVQGRSSPSPSSRLVEWRLGDLDPVTAQTATVIPISVDEYPPADCYAPAASWLETPKITYTRSSVIITMHKTDAYVARALQRSFYTTNWSGRSS